MIIVICGSRYWTDELPIDTFLSLLRNDVSVATGDCRGVDWIVGKLCHQRDIPCRRYEAYWHRYGRVAGPMRNTRILDEEKPNLVVAFHENFNESKGTRDMVWRAQKRGIPTLLITGRG